MNYFFFQLELLNARLVDYEMIGKSIYVLVAQPLLPRLFRILTASKWCHWSLVIIVYMNFEIQIVTTISRYLKRFFKCSSASAVHDFDLFVLILFINIIFSIERKCSRPISFGLAICICERPTHIVTYSLRKNTTTSNCHTKVC